MCTGRSQIGTRHRQYLYEKGPRSIRGIGIGQLTLALSTQLNLSSQLLTPSHNAATRYLYMDGHITQLPKSPLGVLQAPVRRYIPEVLKDLILSRFPPSNADESVASFFERHVGVRATREMVAGIVVGIYGGNIDQLSMQSCFPAFYDAAKKRKSLVRGLLLNKSPSSLIEGISKDLNLTNEEKEQFLKNIEKVKNNGGMFSFANGIDTLTSALQREHGEYIDTSKKIIGISKSSKNGQIEIEFDQTSISSNSHIDPALESATSASTGRSVRTFNSVISSIPSFELSPLLESVSPRTSSILSEIDFASMAVVSLAFEEKEGQKPIIPGKYLGFGYLVPPIENRSILGVSFDSVVFPSHSHLGENGKSDLNGADYPDSKPTSNLVRVAVMMGGNTSNNSNAVDVMTKSKEELLQIALKALKEDMDVDAVPVATDVLVAKNAIPQYAVGHLERVKAIESQLSVDLPQMVLAGASYYGVSVNDCVSSGVRAAHSALSKL